MQKKKLRKFLWTELGKGNIINVSATSWRTNTNVLCCLQSISTFVSFEKKTNKQWLPVLSASTNTTSCDENTVYLQPAKDKRLSTLLFTRRLPILLFMWGLPTLQFFFYVKAANLLGYVRAYAMALPDPFHSPVYSLAWSMNAMLLKCFPNDFP